MKSIIRSAIKNINNRKNKYESVLEEILEDWQEKGSMPENAPKCIQRYIIEDKDKKKFYQAFHTKLQEAITEEKNTTNAERLIQIFTQANNTEINQRVLEIITEVIQEDLADKKSQLKKDEELVKKLLEIAQNNFAEFYKQESQTENKDTNNTSEEKDQSKASLISENKVTENNKVENLSPEATYENLIKLLSEQTSDKSSSSTSSATHKKEAKEQSITDQTTSTFNQPKIENPASNVQTTHNNLETEEKLSKEVETEIAGGKSLVDDTSYLGSQD